MKKNIYFLFALAIFLLAQPGFLNASPLTTNVDLPAGTLVLLEVNEQVKSEQMTVGRIIKCQVMADVVINGKIVIRTGAVATARVKRIKSNTYNEPEELTLTAISAKAVDGQMIALSGIEQTAKGAFPNEPVRLHIGTSLSANVTNNYRICPN